MIPPLQVYCGRYHQLNFSNPRDGSPTLVTALAPSFLLLANRLCSFAGVSLNGADFRFSSCDRTMSDGAEREANADPTAAAAAAAGAVADAAASPVSKETLGGVDVGLLTPLERAAGAGDFQETVTLLASGTALPIGNNAAKDRPLRRSVLHWASWSGNSHVLTAVLVAVARSGVAAQNASGNASASEGQKDAAPAAATKATSDALDATCLKEPGGLNGTTPLHLAAESGHVAAVVILLEARANIDRLDGYHQTPLFLAVDAGHEEVAVELIRQGAHLDAQPDGLGTVLHSAAWNGRLEITEMLLREGAAVNIPNQIGHTPLHFAPNSGPDAAAIIDTLVAAGATVDAVGGVLPIDKTPLLMAVIGECRCNDRGPSIRALVAAVANPHLQLEFSVTPVEMSMVDQNDTEALSVFLELGVDPNHRGPFNRPSLDSPPPDASNVDDRLPYGGASLLHIAARALNDGAVALLLAAGAREDLPVLSDIHQENAPKVNSLPADVIGVEVDENTPEMKRHAGAIRSMLAGAHLYRKGWLSVLRTRFDAGKSLTGSDSGGKHSSRGDSGSDCVEGPSPRRQKGEGKVAVEDEAWYRVALWMASVPSPEIFRVVTDYL